MEIVHTVLILIVACIAFSVLSRRWRLPYAVILVVGGMMLALMPGLPHVTLDPELALAFFLPPLLQVSAWRTDWRAFRASLRPILLLAVGCVLFTALAIALVMKLLVPDLPWAAGLALGAIIAPPDAVAASAILKRLPIPRRIMVTVEGESLVNDATALVLSRVAVAAVAVGGVALDQAIGGFVLVGAGGVVVGLVIGWLADLTFRKLNSDALLVTAASFIACFGSFQLADSLDLSGVIAVVTSGLVIGQRQHRSVTPKTRILARAVWGFVEFVLTSLVFILVGLQLRGVLERVEGRDLAELTGLALAVSAALILSRFVWIFMTSYLPSMIRGMRQHGAFPPVGQWVVVSWMGMRGVVSLAAALALPLGFPERDLLIFLSFCAILATLVVQGPTLEWVIRRFRLEDHRQPGLSPDDAQAWRHVSRAMLAEVERRAEDVLEGAVARDLVNEYREKARVFRGGTEGGSRAYLESRLRIRLAALRAGRAALLDQRRGGGMSDEMLSAIEDEFDLEELQILRVLGVTASGS